MLVASENEIKQAIENCINKRLKKCISIDKLENYIKNNLETWENVGDKNIINHVQDIKDFIFEVDKIEFNNNTYRIVFYNFENLQITKTENLNLLQSIKNYIKAR